MSDKIEGEKRTEEDIDLYIAEFSNTAERWTELTLQSLYRTFELNVKNSEREFNVFLGITSISAAFLTIVAPLIRDALSTLLVLSISFFLLTFLLGLSILLTTIWRDKRLIKTDGDWEHKTYSKFLNESTAIRLKLYDHKRDPGKTPWGEIVSQIESYIDLKDKIKPEADERQRKKEMEPSAILLRRLKAVFWISLSLSLVFLIYWLILQAI